MLGQSFMLLIIYTSIKCNKSEDWLKMKKTNERPINILQKKTSRDSVVVVLSWKKN